MLPKHDDLPLETGAQEHSGRPTIPARGIQFSIAKRRILLIQGDMAVTLLSVLCALWLWALTAQEPFTLAFIWERVVWFFVLPLLWLTLAHANDYYNLRVTSRFSSSVTRLAWISLQLVLAYGIIFLLAPRNLLPRAFILYYAILSLTMIALWRAGRLFLTSRSSFRRRVLIVGTGSASQAIWEAIKQEVQHDYEIVGCVTSAHDRTPAVEGAALLGTGKELVKLVQQYGVSELIVSYVNDVPNDIFQGLMACYRQGIAIVPMPMLYEQITGRIPIELVDQHLWALVLPHEERSLVFNLSQALKRGIDLLLALVGLALFALCFPLLALAIKLDSPGPIFYLQERVGRGDKVFKIVKLRSMIDGAENLTGVRWATDHDTRVTRLGRLMRKVRLDEVPQLINVLAGEMSLVGPRPERPEFVQLLGSEIPFYQTRHVVKPGLTGWAQIRYRYGNSTEDALRKLQYDLYYIRHQSLIFDLTILARTIITIIKFQGT
ncbi:MAG TPA: sugar transferase [Ktedonobacterales bacterium]|jgi:exopolysaccharide biosynthesis polyprenyl glycosylphosphotransferase